MFFMIYPLILASRNKLNYVCSIIRHLDRITGFDCQNYSQDAARSWSELRNRSRERHARDCGH